MICVTPALSDLGSNDTGDSPTVQDLKVEIAKTIPLEEQIEGKNRRKQRPSQHRNNSLLQQCRRYVAQGGNEEAQASTSPCCGALTAKGEAMRGWELSTISFRGV